MKSRILCLRILSLWAFALSSFCFAQTPRELAETGFKSVVLLAMNDASGQPLCVGSGFFVSDDIVATNAHVIEEAGSGSAKLVGQAQVFNVLGVLAIDSHADLALLKVSGAAPALPLGHGLLPAVGDNVYVIGNPLGLEGTFSEGIVSGLRKTGADSVIQMTAPISPGSSGGPVMDAHGDVIGVSVATFTQGQNLNLAVPIAYLEQMLQTHPTALMPLQSASVQAKKTRSIMDGLGTRTENGVIGGDFTTDSFSYSFSLSNKLPVVVSKISILVIFYDHAGKMLDFERCDYDQPIPAGLTKNIRQGMTAVTSDILYQVRGYKKVLPGRAEIRVIGFNAGASQY
jgi:S1-C subfamily serine protease